jgi:hypothetical protein
MSLILIGLRSSLIASAEPAGMNTFCLVSGGRTGRSEVLLEARSAASQFSYEYGYSIQAVYQ